jgi:hypothetical protein
MERRINWSLIGVFLVASLCWVGYVSEAAGAVTLELYDPAGASEVTILHAPRLDTLAGKTICELADNQWESWRTFPLIESLLKRQFPTSKIIPWDAFPNDGDHNYPNWAAHPGILKEKGCDAVIVGNAG